MSAPLRKDPRRTATQQHQQQRDSFPPSHTNSSSENLGTTPLGGAVRLHTTTTTAGSTSSVLSGLASSDPATGLSPSISVQAKRPATPLTNAPTASGAQELDSAANCSVDSHSSSPDVAQLRSGTLRKRSSMNAVSCPSPDGASVQAFSKAARAKGLRGSGGGTTGGGSGRGAANVLGATGSFADDVQGDDAAATANPAPSSPAGSSAASTAPSPIAAMLPTLQSRLKLSEGLNCVDFLPMFRALAIGSTRQLHVVEVVPAIAYDLQDLAKDVDPQQRPAHHYPAADCAKPGVEVSDGLGDTAALPHVVGGADAGQKSEGGPLSGSPFVLRPAGSFGGLVKVESVAWYPSDEEASLAFIQPGRSITVFLDALQFKADGTFITQQWTRSQRKEKMLHASMAVGAGSTDSAVVATTGAMLSSTPLTSLSMGSTHTQNSSVGGGGGRSNSGIGVGGGVGVGSVKESFVTREQRGTLAKELIELNIDTTYMRVEKILWDPHNPYTLALSSTATYFELWQIPTDGERVYAPRLVLRPPAHNTRATVRDVCFAPSDPNLIVVMSELASAGQVLLYDRRQVEIPRVVDCISMGPGLAAAFHPLFSDLLAVAFRKEKTKSDCRVAFLRVIEEDVAAASQLMLARNTTASATGTGQQPQQSSARPPTPSGLDTPTTDASIGSSAPSPLRPPPLPFAAAAATSAPVPQVPSTVSVFDEANSSTHYPNDAASVSVFFDYPGVALQDTLPPVDCFASISKLRWRPPSFGSLTEPHPHHHYLGFRPSLSALLRDTSTDPIPAATAAPQGEEGLSSPERTGVSDAPQGSPSLPHSPLSPAAACMTPADQLRQRRVDLVASQLWFATTATTTDLDVSVWDATCSFFPICSVGYQTKESREPNDFVWVNELAMVSVFKGGEVIVTSLLSGSPGTLLPATITAAGGGSSGDGGFSTVAAVSTEKVNGGLGAGREAAAAAGAAGAAGPSTREALHLPVYPRDEAANIFSLHSILPTSVVTTDFFGRSFAVRNTAVPLRCYYTHVIQQECNRLVKRLVFQIRQEERARGRIAAWRSTVTTPSLQQIQSRILQSQMIQQQFMQQRLGGANAQSQSSVQQQQQQQRNRLGSRTGSGFSVRPHRAAPRGAGLTDSPLLPSPTTQPSDSGPCDASSPTSTGCTSPVPPEAIPSTDTQPLQSHREEEEAGERTLHQQPASMTELNTAQQGRGGRVSTSPSLPRPDAAELKIPLVARLFGFRRKRESGPTGSATRPAPPGGIQQTPTPVLGAAASHSPAAPPAAEATQPAQRSPRNLSVGEDASTNGSPLSPITPCSPQHPPHQRPGQVTAADADTSTRRHSPHPSSYKEEHVSGGGSGEAAVPASATRTHTVTRYGPSPEEGFRSGLLASARAGSHRVAGATGGRPAREDLLARNGSSSGAGELGDGFQDAEVSGLAGATSAVSIDHVRMFPLLEQSAVQPIARLTRSSGGSGVGGLSGSPSTPKAFVTELSGGSAHAATLSRKAGGTPTMSVPPQHQQQQQAANASLGGGSAGQPRSGPVVISSLKMRPTILTSPFLLPASPVNRLVSPVSLEGGMLTTVTSSVTFPSPVRAETPLSPTAAVVGSAASATTVATEPTLGNRKLSVSKECASPVGNKSCGSHNEESGMTRMPVQALEGHLLPQQRNVQPVMESFVLSDAVCGWSYTERGVEEALFARYALQWDMGYELALNMKRLRHLCDDAAEKRKARRLSPPRGGQRQQPSHRPARQGHHNDAAFAGSNRLIQDMLGFEGGGGDGTPVADLDDEDDILAAALHFSKTQADSLFAALMERNAHICEVQERAMRHEQELRRHERSDPTTSASANLEGVAIQHREMSSTAADAAAFPTNAQEALPPTGQPERAAAGARFAFTRDPRSQWWRAAAHAWRSHRLDIILTVTTSQLEYASLIGDAQYSLVLYVLFCLWWRLRYLPDRLHMKAAMGSATSHHGEPNTGSSTDPLAWRSGGEVPSTEQASGRRGGGEGACRAPPPCPLLPERQPHQQQQQQQQQSSSKQQLRSDITITNASKAGSGVAAAVGSGARAPSKFPPPPSLASVTAAFGGGSGGQHSGPFAGVRGGPQQQQQPQLQPPPHPSPKPEAAATSHTQDDTAAATTMVGGCTPQQWKLRALQWLEAYTSELYARRLYVPLNELLLIFPEITQEPGNPVQPRAADIAYEKQMTYVFCGHCPKSELDAKVPKAKAGGDAGSNLKFFQGIVGRQHWRSRRTHRRRGPQTDSPFSAVGPSMTASSSSPHSTTSCTSSASSQSFSSFHAGLRSGGKKDGDVFSDDDAVTTSTEMSTPSLTNLQPGDQDIDVCGLDADFFKTHNGASEAPAGTATALSSTGRSTKRRARGLSGSGSTQSSASMHSGRAARSSSCVSATSSSAGSTSSTPSSCPQVCPLNEGGGRRHQRRRGRKARKPRSNLGKTPAAAGQGTQAVAPGAGAGVAAAMAAASFVEMPTAIAYDAAHQPLPPADNAACRRCHNRLAMTCVICEEVVEGMYYWLRSCGHGGHVRHMEEWLRVSNACPKCGAPISSALKQS